jgi:hypothetical protein
MISESDPNHSAATDHIEDQLTESANSLKALTFCPACFFRAAG